MFSRRSRVSKYQRKRVVKSYLKRKSRRGNLTVTKLREVQLATTTGAGILDELWKVNDPRNQQDWGAFQTLYDSYRVYAVKIKFIPSMPNDTSTVTGYSPMYYMFDVDSTAAPLTVNDFIQYENLRVKNLYMPHSVYFRIPKYTAFGSSGVATLAGGFLDTQAGFPSNGIICGISGPLDTTTTYGTFITTYYIGFKNRR